MKKLIFPSLFILILALISLTSYSLNTEIKNSNSGIPDSIMAIFNKSCTGCHSKEGNFIAKGKVNFSKWEKYSVTKQSAKANAICDVMTESRMPPAGWKKNNEKLVPTKKELDAICKWAASLNAGK